MLKKPYLSKTQLNMLARCQMQWHFRYEEGLKRPPPVVVITGGATHAGPEADLGRKIKTGALLETEAISDIVATEFDHRWDGEQGVQLDQAERDEGEAKVRGRAKDQAIALAQLHHKAIAPKLEPTHVERAFRLILRAYPYDLVGFIDVQEPGGIRDTKTAGKRPSLEAVNRSVELSLYATAYRRLEGEWPKYVSLDVLLKSKKNNECAMMATIRGDADYRQLMRRVQRAIEVIEAGVFSPAPPDSWCCSERFCGYWDICPFGAKQTTKG